MTAESSKLPENKISGRARSGQRDIGDLFSPFFRIKFTNVSKAEVKKEDPLISDTDFGQGAIKSGLDKSNPLAQDLDTLELDSRLLPKTAASLKIESKAGSPLKFTLALTPPYDDGIRILNSGLLNFGTLVTVQWGYTSWGSEGTILSDVFVFRNNFPQAQFGQDISIIVSGHDLTASVGSRNSRTKTWSFTEYKTDLAIVEEIVKRTNVELDIDREKLKSSNFLTGDNRPEAEDGKKSPDAGIQQNVNDWAFIRRLCNDHGLSFTSQGNKFRIFSLFNASGDTDYSYRFLWRKPLVTKRDIPLYNIRGNLLPFLFLPAEGSGLIQYNFDPDADPEQDGGGSTVVEKSPATKDDPSMAAGGESGDANAVSSKAGMVGGPGDGEAYEMVDGVLIPRPKPKKDEDGPPTLSVPAGTHNAEEKLNKIVNDCQAFSHPMVGVNAPGVVDMWPGVTVMMEGASDLFDGPYFVLNATHTIGNSGYDMELKLMRHTVKGHADQQSTAPLVHVNSEGDQNEADKAIDESAKPPPDQVALQAQLDALQP